MTNAEFIRRLKKARKLALGSEHSWRIVDACQSCGIYWEGLLGHLGKANATFGEGTEYQDLSSAWLRKNGNTDENVRAVFDNSIKALGGKP